MSSWTCLPHFTHRLARGWRSWNFSLHIHETLEIPGFCKSWVVICLLSIFFLRFLSHTHTVCSADAQGGLNVTKHDGKPQFSPSLIYDHHLNCALLFPSALFLLLFHPIFLSFLCGCCFPFPPSFLRLSSLPLSLLLLLFFSVGRSAGCISFSPLILTAVCEDRDVHEGDSFLPCATCRIQAKPLSSFYHCFIQTITLSGQLTTHINSVALSFHWSLCPPPLISSSSLLSF